MAKIRKAIFPVGGLGTRFLPATKSMPKEMLPVVDKPLVHYAFEEAVAAGIEQFIFVTGRNKDAIMDHFDHSYELQSVLSERDKKQELELTNSWMPEPGNISFTRQQEALGLGHAVWCARHFIDNEPFAVLLADDLFQCDPPCLKQMVDAYEEVGGSIMAVMDVPKGQTSRYGILDVESDDGRLARARGLVEKPKPEEAPSTLAIAGRYILQPEIMDHLSKHETGAGGEIQLTDAMEKLLATSPFHGLRFQGRRFDCGNKVGFIEANLAYALEREDMGKEIKEILKNYS